MTSKTSNTATRSGWQWRFRRFGHKYGTGLMFFLPFFTLFALFIIVPVIISFATSLCRYDLINAPKWAGIDNYIHVFLEDDVFLTALKNTLTIAIISGPAGYLASFLMAWFINQVRFKRLYSLAFYAPSICSAIAMSAVWLYLFSGDRYGFINNFLMQIGAITEPVQWNTDIQTILPVVILISVWMSMGSGFLVFLAGFQNIPRSLYEAAKVDGIRNPVQELIYITLPAMKPQLLFGAINSIMGAFAAFDVPVAVSGMPSPGYASHTLVAHLYDYAFIRFDMGNASTVAVLLFTLTFVLQRICFKIFAEKE
ncbi:MAG: sugar ABC transporter permease [Clostridiales bacterium]|nr:sugar ABC transporter permease [Clostridiales bacterium]